MTTITIELVSLWRLMEFGLAFGLGFSVAQLLVGLLAEAWRES